MNDLYRELILDRYKHPQYRGTLDPHDFFFADENPLCGDHLEIAVRLGADGRVSEAAFEGHGCAISLAAVDLLLESIIGRTLDEVKELTKEDVLDLLGVPISPVRLKCALLSLKVLKAGVYGLEQATDDLVE
jgi:nitrogen fixation NifU-like protein